MKIDDYDLIKEAAVAGFADLNKEQKVTAKTIEYIYQRVVEKEMISYADYEDYLNWCEDLGMNLKDKRILYPKDFKKAHDEVQIQYTSLKRKDM